jgi:hypothetical protein
LLDQEITFLTFRDLNFQQEATKRRDIGLINYNKLRVSLRGETKRQVAQQPL